MKPTKISILLLLLSSWAIIACSSTSTTEGPDNKEGASLQAGIENPLEKDLPNEPFQEGIIQTKVTFPGNHMAELYSKVDFTQGNIEQQLEKMYQKMSTSERAEMMKSTQGMGLMSLAILMTPFKGDIYYKKEEVLAKAEGLTYFLENYQNTLKNEGFYVIKSRTGTDAVTMSYTPSNSGKTWQSLEVNYKDYTISDMKKTLVIAGYPCNGKQYELKKTVTPTSTNGTSMNAKPVKLEVYTSRYMPKEINFQHPIYIPEADGILKIIAYFDQEKKMTIVYEASKVIPKTLKESNMALQKSTPVYNMDNESELMQGGFKMLSIMMGNSSAMEESMEGVGEY